MKTKKVSGYVKTFRMDMFLEETIENDYDPIYNDPYYSSKFEYLEIVEIPENKFEIFKKFLENRLQELFYRFNRKLFQNALKGQK